MCAGSNLTCSDQDPCTADSCDPKVGADRRLFLGAKGLKFARNLLSKDTNAEVKIVGRRGIDGRNWTTFGNNIANGGVTLDGQASGITALGEGSNIYAKDPDDFPERVQLGIQVRNATYASVVPQVSFRLVMSVTVLYERFHAIVPLALGAAIASSGDIIDFDGSTFDKGSLILTVAGATPATLQFQLKISADGTNYPTVETSATISAAGTPHNWAASAPDLPGCVACKRFIAGLVPMPIG